MRKVAVGVLCGLFAGLWIGARIQASILTDATPVPDYHPNAVTYANTQAIPIPESLENEDTVIFKTFIDVFSKELNKNYIHDRGENYRVYRTGILHIRKPRLIFQEAGEPAFYADSVDLHRTGSNKIFIIRLSEIHKKMSEAIESGGRPERDIMDFQDLMDKVIIPYAKKEAEIFAERNRK